MSKENGTPVATEIINGVSEGVKNFFNTATHHTGQGVGITSDILLSTMNAIGNTVLPFKNVQKEASELARSLGLAGDSIMKTATNVVAQNKAFSWSMKYNVSDEEILRLESGILQKLGRNIEIGDAGTVGINGEIIGANVDSTIENIVAARRLVGEGLLGDIVEAFDRVGISMKTAAKATGKLYQEAGKYGINLNKYANNFVSHMDMAQKYNFRNGVDGLREMARKATEIRQNMGQIASFAEKVGSVTGAVETAARLQVLGGQFTALADPLSMLNESLTNMEGLQDRFNSMIKGMASYDKASKQVRMNAVDRIRLKAAAEAMGVDYGNALEQAFAEARRTEIEDQMASYGGLREDVRALLKNTGQIDTETGVAGANINGQFRTIAEIAGNKDLQDEFIRVSRSESDDVKEIAKSVMHMEDLMVGRGHQVVNAAAANNIKAGVYKGVSEWDAITDLYLNGFTDDLIAAAEKMDFPIKNLATVITSTNVKGVAQIASSVNSSSLQEFFDNFSDNMKKTFGDSELATGITAFLTDIISGVSKYAISIDDYLKKNTGTSFLGPTFNSPFGQIASNATVGNDALADVVKQLGGNQVIVIGPGGNAETGKASAAVSTTAAGSTASTAGRTSTGIGVSGTKTTGTAAAPVAGTYTVVTSEDLYRTLLARNETFSALIDSIKGTQYDEITKTIRGSVGKLENKVSEINEFLVENNKQIQVNPLELLNMAIGKMGEINLPEDFSLTQEEINSLFAGMASLSTTLKPAEKQEGNQINGQQNGTVVKPEFEANEKSIPVTVVYPGRQTATENGSPQGQHNEPQPSNINVNLSGDFTMTVNSKDGKLTEVDIKKVFNDDGFKQAFTKMIMLAMKDQIGRTANN